MYNDLHINNLNNLSSALFTHEANCSIVSNQRLSYLRGQFFNIVGIPMKQQVKSILAYLHVSLSVSTKWSHKINTCNRRRL